MKTLNQGFDHVEFVVEKMAPHAERYRRMGFEKIGSRADLKKGQRTEAWAQGLIRILVTEVGPESDSMDHNTRFFRKHGDGVSVLALEVENAEKAFLETTRKGARSAMEPKRIETPQGTVTRAEIFTPADLRFAFIERHLPKGGSTASQALLDHDLVAKRLESPSPLFLRQIDHLTNNVNMGDTKTWVDYYTQVFDFTVTRHFDINTGRTGLTSEVVQSRDFKIKVPINEATEPKSQVQEFYDRFHGVGVQHLAFATTDIISTLKAIRGENLFKLLSVPSTYYEMVPKRVPQFTENLKELEELGILLDGEGGGYLLQIFTEELVGPFFLEFIQRKGNEGFGEGNFKALFEAIERDQIRRGVL